ncbi:MAG: serine/threonine protein kinase [Deltaproteobacteria bacterium]|nr:serine/threonine protein kinase [Deltaproteobacteria bacterium]
MVEGGSKASERPDFIPYSIGPYTVFEKIGEGGMAEIFLAQRRIGLGTAQRVVLKRLLPYLAEDTDLVQALVHEAKVAARLGSGNVAQVIDLEEYDGTLYIEMEYIEGLDLNQILRLLTKHQLSVSLSFVFHVIAGMLSGVEAVHAVRNEDGSPMGLVHMDISPGNILVSFEGEVKICDFGIARSTARDIMDRSRNKIQGKFSYMSPEQAMGRDIDHRSDIFTCGIVMWELLTGRKMYRSEDPRDVYDMAVQAKVPQLPDRGFPDYPELHDILSHALRKDVDQRYGSARSFHEAVDEYVLKHGILRSQIEIGRFLTENFSEDILELRRIRERLIGSLAPLDEG